MSYENRKNNSVHDYEMWALAHREAPQSKTGKFLTMSAILHVAIFSGLAIMAVPLVEQSKVEVVTIEIEEPVRQLSRGQMVAATQGHEVEAVSAPATAPELLSDDDFKDVVVAKAAPDKRAAKVAEKSKAKSVAQPKTARPAIKSAQVAAAPAAPRVATIDDIEAPEIDAATEDMKHAWTPSDVANAVADEDLDGVDQAHAQMMDQEKNQLDQELSAVQNDSEEALKDLQDQSQQESEAIEAQNKSRRAQDAKAIAAAARSEEYAQAAAARQKAMAAAKAQRQQEGIAARGRGQGAGSSSAVSAAPAGVPNGVRSLEQLRQMPGNRGPQYSRQERLNREQGTVSFLAYVTKEGRLAKFRKVSGTGYENLDEKTLVALQKWKFYPGQEGWVELPFRWDIKGDPQAVDGMLRVTSNQR